MVRIVLASASPRRAELLRQIGLAFETLESSVPEEPGDETDPAMLAEKLALLKAQAAAGKCSAEVIIAADTIVSADGKLLDKPRDVREAAAMLRSLSGRRHEVLTGVAVIDRRGGRLLTHVEKTAVYMRVIPDDELDWYVQSGEPFDKAGGYGIQGRAAVFVERVEGCYFNVVGLPLSALWRMLHRLGVEPWEGAGFVDFTAPDHQGPASA
ncbi:MAG: Maf-like protein YhdE [Syntrophomonadaceae bacterium]|nr:Maf-like protein YhdE [Bacillota bacterium]